MGNEANSGVAAPAAVTANPSAAGELPRELMRGVFERFGAKLPDSIKSEGDAPTGDAEAAPSHVAAPAAENTEAAADESVAADADSQSAAAAGGATPAAGAPANEGEAAAPADEHAAETAKAVALKLKNLPPEQRKLVQSVIDGRINEITKKSREESERLGNRVTELTGELEQTRKQGGAPIVIPGVHPALLAESPEQVEKHVADFAEFEDWADRYKDTGYEGNAEKGEPSFTPEQIRAKLREAKRELEKVIPQARANLQTRSNLNAQLKQVMPSLFDPKSEDFRLVQQALKALPEVRKFPDSHVIVAQQILGQRALQKIVQEYQAAQGNAPANSAANKAKPTAAVPPKKAPRAPGGGSPARGSVLDMPNGQPAASDAVKTAAKNRDRSSLTDAVRALVFSG